MDSHAADGLAPPTTMETDPPSFPSTEETLAHPSYPSVRWNLEPHQQGRFAAATTRGGPVHISWETHGEGPLKIIFLMGLAGIKTNWQRQTKHFGHDHGDRYTVLILDNRGAGASDKPLSRYSTTTMALDVHELLGHLGWLAVPRSLNLVGISLGGMIAQELALMIPQSLASLSLLSTYAVAEPAQGGKSVLAERIGMAVPKSEERAILDTAHSVFEEDWMLKPDDAEVPDPKTTPRCGPPKGLGEGAGYGGFKSNFQRWQAAELTKRRDPGAFGMKGFLLQLIAAGWHNKSPLQIRELGDKVGRQRIMVLHGEADKMIDVRMGRKLIQLLQPAKSFILPGVGHCLFMTRTKWFNALLEERFAECAALGKED